MTGAIRLLVLGSVVVATACGSSSPSGGNAPTVGTATFSGAATGTLSVYVIGNKEPSNSYTSLTMVSGVYGSTSVTYPTFGFEAQLPGASLPTGTFASGDAAGTLAQTDYINASMATWGQFSGPSDPFGTFSLTISSAGSATSEQSTSVWWSSHGTLSATMVPANDNGGSGEISVSVTF